MCCVSEERWLMKLPARKRGDFMSLTVSGLSKKYHNKTANRDVSFEIGKGINGLLGANGAGKTTLMRMICGVVKPDSGSISLDGIEVGDSEYLKGIGYLPQDFGYYPNFTAKSTWSIWRP